MEDRNEEEDWRPKLLATVPVVTKTDFGGAACGLEEYCGYTRLLCHVAGRYNPA